VIYIPREGLTVIYHFCPRADWAAAQRSGRYAAESLAAQGFIHCSPRDQVHEPANLLARGRTDLVQLEIDESRLAARPVWEDGDPPHPDGRQFPHVYGPIPVAAVRSVTDYLPGPDGLFH
jgi:uncharacterized protein (DUF952 family)